MGFRVLFFISKEEYEKLLLLVRTGRLDPPVAAWLFQRHHNGASPILTPAQIARDNALAEIHVFSITCHDAKILKTPVGLLSYAHNIVQSIVNLLLGYHIKAAILEGYSTPARLSCPNSGFDVEPSFTFPDYYAKNSTHRELKLFIANAHMSHMHRKIGTAAANAVNWRTPILELTSRQREVLELALDGADDDVIAAHLGITAAGVRQHFSTVGKRVSEAFPDLLPARSNRTVLLDYFRIRRHETRPYGLPDTEED